MEQSEGEDVHGGGEGDGEGTGGVRVGKAKSFAREEKGRLNWAGERKGKLREGTEGKLREGKGTICGETGARGKLGRGQKEVIDAHTGNVCA